MKFDYIVGNPPYQEDNPNNGRSAPVYNYFMDLAFDNAEKVCLITPARFLSNSGQTPSKWNHKILNDEHFKIAKYWVKSDEVFSNTDIRGGVAITIRDEQRICGPVGTFTPFNEQASILEKVAPSDATSLMSVCVGAVPYHYSQSLRDEHPEYVEFTGGSFDLRTNALNNLYNKIYFDAPTDDDDWVKIVGLLNKKRVSLYVKRKYIEVPDNFDAWKVVLPKSNGSGAVGEVLSTPLIGHTQTFISIGRFETQLEAQGCLKYIKSKFARFMLGILKTTQDNSRSTWAKVPLQDFGEGSDIDWSKSVSEIDEQLYRKYGLDAHEIEFIESKVKAME